MFSGNHFFGRLAGTAVDLIFGTDNQEPATEDQKQSLQVLLASYEHQMQHKLDTLRSISASRRSKSVNQAINELVEALTTLNNIRANLFVTKAEIELVKKHMMTFPDVQGQRPLMFAHLANYPHIAVEHTTVLLTGLK